MNAVRSRLTSLGSSQSVVLGILCLGVFSTALDQTVVVAALPSVMVDLEIPLTDLDRASWIVTGYLVSYTVAMPLAGRLSDVHGRVRMFQAGASYIFHRVCVCCCSAELPLGGVRQGYPGRRRRCHGPDRAGYGSGSCGAAAKGNCPGTRGRLSRSWVCFRPPLRRRHNRMGRLAVDILAGHTPELLSNSAFGHLAESRQSCG